MPSKLLPFLQPGEYSRVGGGLGLQRATLHRIAAAPVAKRAAATRPEAGLAVRGACAHRARSPRSSVGRYSK